MSQHAFLFFDSTGKISDSVLSVLSDSSILGRFDAFSDYLTAHSFHFEHQELLRLCRFFENSILNQVRYYVFLTYRMLELSDKKDEHQWRQYHQSFARKILNIPFKDMMHWDDMNRFEVAVGQILESLQLHTRSLESLESEYSQFRFTVLGRRMDALPEARINKLFKFLGSDLFLFMPPSGKGKRMMVFRGRYETIDTYLVCHAREEIVRSPLYVIPNVAVVQEHVIVLRDESFKCIFAQKWLAFFNPDSFVEYKNRSDIYWNISSGIKSHVLSLYGADSEDKLLKDVKVFLKDMKEIILFHELGHGVVNHYLLDNETRGVCGGMKIFYDDLFESLTEYLADFCPAFRSVSGCMQRMVEVSKTDVLRAQRMFFMYFSDVWFFDTEDKDMYIYSEILSLMLVRYIRPDLSVDFDLIQKDIAYRPDADEKSVFHSILDRVLQDAGEFIRILKTAKYTIGDKVVDFNRMHYLRLENAKQDVPMIDPNSMAFHTYFWNQMLFFCNCISDQAKALETQLRLCQSRTVNDIFALACGRDVAESYAYDIRKYIVDRMVELGLVVYPVSK